MLDGKLYAAGGQNEADGEDEADGATSNSVERCDLTTKAWEVVAPMVTPHENHALAVLDGKLYAVGGYSDVPSCSSSLQSSGTTRRWMRGRRWRRWRSRG